jgi:signal transduction histidine kinase
VASVPIALICIVEADRQCFLSRQGLGTIDTPREVSFCSHSVLREAASIVPDTRDDPRFADNPLVIGAPFGRFYAGYPIRAPGGARVATLCVMDTRPRHLASEELRDLADLAALAEVQMLAVRFNVATRTVGVGVHERHLKHGDVWWSDAMWDIVGQDPGTFRPSADNWLALIHPEDREYVRENGGAWGRPRTSVSLQYRIVRADGTIRYLQSLASTTSNENGVADCFAGVTLDVTERVTAEQRQHWQQQKLRESSHQAGMAEIATGILHSVGNVVNSLGIAHETMRRDLKALRVEQLEQATTLIRANRGSMASFFTDDARGRHLPDYLGALAAEISSNVHCVRGELDTVEALLEHLRGIISAQQVRANLGHQREPVDLKELLDATLMGLAPELCSMQVMFHHQDLPLVTTDRHKLLLIFVNLLNNARDAVLACALEPRRIVVQLGREGDEAVISIEDSGIGMSPEVLSRLWRFGFTTKANGQGFDLHNSANAAREIGATITAHSDGTDKGSRFTVRLPI